MFDGVIKFLLIKLPPLLPPPPLMPCNTTGPFPIGYLILMSLIVTFGNENGDPTKELLSAFVSRFDGAES